MRPQLIIEYDENNSQLLFSELNRQLSPRTREIFRVSVSDAAGALDLAAQVGGEVVAFFEAFNPGKFINSKEREILAFDDGHEKTAYEEAKIAIGFFDDSSNLVQLEKIDELLEIARLQIDESAIKYLKNSWPALRKVLVKRLSKNS